MGGGGGGGGEVLKSQSLDSAKLVFNTPWINLHLAMERDSSFVAII